jgi:hypothetical protein
MWNILLDDYGFTWKELARLYELEILSGYKLNFGDVANWHSKLSFGYITWEELYQLFKMGKPIPTRIGDNYKYITITPDLLLKDVLKKIIKTWNISRTPNQLFQIFEISFNHPLKGYDDVNNVIFDFTDDSVKLLHVATDEWLGYEDVPIGENGTFDIIYEIKVIE